MSVEVTINTIDKDTEALGEINSEAMLKAIDELSRAMALVRKTIGQRIFGQDSVIDETLVTLLAGGHVLLVGVPGLGKTQLVETLATVFGMDTRRVQFTPDLMPADILGSEVLEEATTGLRSFRFLKGPVFCQVLMADEINRASPRTQSALLQAMQENRVSVAGEYYNLPSPFHVLATQNPIEQEGTYPLPEAQLDRFFMQVDVNYPELSAERQILVKTTGPEQAKIKRTMKPVELIAGQTLVRRIPVGENVAEGILTLVRAGRPEISDLKSVRDCISWGPGPRASQALMLGARARAVMQGRLAPSIDDVISLAHPILRHRMSLNFAARAEGVTLASIIDSLCERIG